MQPLPSFSSSTTLRPASGVDEDAREDDVEGTGRRRAIYDDERPVIDVEGEGKAKEKGKSKAKLLDTLCCRAQTGTLVDQSRLPVRIAAAVPGRKRYKLKTGLVRMTLESRSQILDSREGSSTTTTRVSQRPRTTPPDHRRPDEAVSLLSTPQSSSSASCLPSPSNDDSEGIERSLEERLRNTTLEDLPLSQRDAENVRELMAELVGDREGMSGTWPPRSRRGAGRAQVRGDTFGGNGSGVEERR
jgi:hypothetical protein